MMKYFECHPGFADVVFAIESDDDLEAFVLDYDADVLLTHTLSAMRATASAIIKGFPATSALAYASAADFSHHEGIPTFHENQENNAREAAEAARLEHVQRAAQLAAKLVVDAAIAAADAVIAAAAAAITEKKRADTKRRADEEREAAFWRRHAAEAAEAAWRAAVARIRNPGQEDAVAEREAIARLQNVHDHGVTCAARLIIKRLEEQPDPSCMLQHDGRIIICQVDAAFALRKDVSLDKVQDARRTLACLNGETLVCLGTSDLRALALVWCRISNNVAMKHDLISTLCTQLAQAVEHGAVVCATGRVMRILCTLDGCDDSLMECVKPMWVIQKELDTLAGAVRRDVLSECSPELRALYDAGSAPDLEARMRDVYIGRAVAIYCYELGMTYEVLRPHIEVNCAEF